MYALLRLSSRTATLALVALAGIVACAHGPGDRSGAAGPGPVPSIANHRFRIQEITEDATQRRIAPASPIFISFAPDTFLANTGCNDITGTHSIDGNNRRVDRSATGFRGCPPPLIDQNALMTRVLQPGAVIALEGSELRVRNDGVTLRATLDPE